jgi:hypothetical protein
MGLVFDGWKSYGTYFVCFFAVAPGPPGEPAFTCLLSFSPLINEESHDADTHIELLKATLSLYKKEVSDVLFLSGDNCSTNKSISNKLGVPLLGCSSHRLNLAVQKYLVQFDDVIAGVQKLMVELRKTLNRAKLKSFTKLKPLLRNETRWSSTHAMIKRFGELLKDGLVECFEVNVCILYYIVCCFELPT